VSASSGIEFRLGNDLDLDAVIELYRASTLGERRPIDDRERMQAMLQHADIVVTAWDDHTMVGIARSVSDFAYFTYLSDLAVRVSHQRQGIGRELIRRTRDAGGPETNLLLLSAPAAVDYYPRLGFSRHESAWILRPADELKGNSRRIWPEAGSQ
jgi:predicted N-acetyltransferase YhbS